MNIDEEFDLIVIGSGPGGQKAAIQGANGGLKVALFERGCSGWNVHSPQTTQARPSEASPRSPPLDGTPVYSISN